MRKLLIMLMVVAMSSFLLVGCLDGVTPEPTPEPEPGIKTETPEIDSVSGDTNEDGYINAVEKAGVTVIGHAIEGSLIRLYLDGDVVATDVATKGAKSVGNYAMFTFEDIDLGKDGAKALYVTAKQLGLDESDASDSYKFTLDTKGPGIDSVAFTAYALPGATGGTAKLTDGGTVVATAAPVGGDEAKIVTGVWTIEVTELELAAYKAKIQITGPSGYSYSPFWHVYEVDGAGVAFTSDILIPGVTFTLVEPLNQIFAKSEIVCEAQSAEIAGRATLKFDEDVSYAAATATTCVYGGEVAGKSIYYKETNNTAYWKGLTGIDQDNITTYTITVYGVTDLVGNVGGTSAVPLTKSAIAGAASLTALAP